VGLRPKQFARVVRLSALLPALEGESAPDWAQLAQLAGYHDQAHFNREFRLFAGLSPRKYISLRTSYFEHYPGGEVDTRFVPLG
jgi:AraC-like DNA-binding protein